MKSVKFWEAMRARDEGKSIAREASSKWILPQDEFTHGTNPDAIKWKILEEPREFTVAKHCDGSLSVAEGLSNLVYYKENNRPIEVIKVREVLDESP